MLGQQQIEVYLVDGRKIRDYFDTDFVESGHDLVYPWIPPFQIWVEYTQAPDEIPFLVLHELTERKLMAKGLGYDEAHKIASNTEWEARQKRREVKSLRFGRQVKSLAVVGRSPLRR